MYTLTPPWPLRPQHESAREATLPRLNLGDHYVVFVKSLSPNLDRESNETHLDGGLLTKSCLEAHDHNLTLCGKYE